MVSKFKAARDVDNTKLADLVLANNCVCQER